MANIFRFLDTVGDGTGTKNANVNGAVTPQVFKYVPSLGDRTEIYRMLVHIADTAPISADEYGGVAALANGVTAEIRNQGDDTTVVDLTDGIPITNNSGWSRMCYDMDADSFGSGADFAKARWTFSRSGGPLYIQDNQYFCAVVNDDLTGLIEHYFHIQGIKGRA